MWSHLCTWPRWGSEGWRPLPGKAGNVEVGPEEGEGASHIREMQGEAATAGVAR